MRWSLGLNYLRAAILASVFSILAWAAGTQLIPNSGQQITPAAPTGARFDPLNPGLADNPQYLAGQAVTSLVSPDGKTLLVLTSGYNLVDSASGSMSPADSTQFIFVYDISRNTPAKKQVIQIPNTYSGMVFDPSGREFYVSGGVDDDVHVYTRAQNGIWIEQPGSPIALGHGAAGVGLSV